MMKVLPVKQLSRHHRENPHPSSLASPRRSANVTAMHILLVEDDPAMQTSLQRALARRGIHVSRSADGLQAHCPVASPAPDVVVLDLSLPGMDGLQVLEHLRALHATTPVLILTARSTVGDRVLGLNAGPTTTWPSPSTWTSWKRACVRWSGVPRRRQPAHPASPLTPALARCG